MYIDPRDMDDDQLLFEIEAAREELDVFIDIAAARSKREAYNPMGNLREVKMRLRELVAEGSRRGLDCPNYGLL